MPKITKAHQKKTRNWASAFVHQGSGTKPRRKAKAKSKSSEEGWRRFVILNPNKDFKEWVGKDGRPHVARGRQPRDAALKFARKYRDHILIRETGTNTVHKYLGRRFIKPLTEAQEEYRKKYPERFALRTGPGEDGKNVRGIMVTRVKKMKPGTFKLELLDGKRVRIPAISARHKQKTKTWASAFVHTENADLTQKAKSKAKAKKGKTKKNATPTRKSARQAARK